MKELHERQDADTDLDLLYKMKGRLSMDSKAKMRKKQWAGQGLGASPAAGNMPGGDVDAEPIEHEKSGRPVRKRNKKRFHGDEDEESGSEEIEDDEEKDDESSDDQDHEKPIFGSSRRRRNKIPGSQARKILKKEISKEIPPNMNDFIVSVDLNDIGRQQKAGTSAAGQGYSQT